MLILQKEVKHGWSTFALSASFLIYAGIARAGVESPHSQSLTSDDIFKIAITLGAIFIAQALIPAARSYYERFSERRTFRIYLYVHAKNTKASYGKECSVQMAQRLIEERELPGWLDVLASSGLGAPQQLIDMHVALTRAEQSATDDDTERYYPYLSYFGVPGSPLEMNSPLWKSSDRISRRASSYLITELQIATSISAQYEPDYLDLMRKGGVNQRQRWCAAGRGILLDMAEHYVATIRLLRELESTIKKL